MRIAALLFISSLIVTPAFAQGYGLDDVSQPQSLVITQGQPEDIEVRSFDDMKKKMEASRLLHLKEIEKNNNDMVNAQIQQLAGEKFASDIATEQNKTANVRAAIQQSEQPADSSMGGLFAAVPENDGNKRSSSSSNEPDRSMGGLLAP